MLIEYDDEKITVNSDTWGGAEKNDTKQGKEKKQFEGEVHM